jgi:DNA-binding IclR family transcriptional regulator
MVVDIHALGFSRCQSTLLLHFTSLLVPIFNLLGRILAALTMIGPVI